MKCKSRTGTENPVRATASNGRHMIKGVCSECGTKKSKFVSTDAAIPSQGAGFKKKTK